MPPVSHSQPMMAECAAGQVRDGTDVAASHARGLEARGELGSCQESGLCTDGGVGCQAWEQTDMSIVHREAPCALQYTGEYHVSDDQKKRPEITDGPRHTYDSGLSRKIYDEADASPSGASTNWHLGLKPVPWRSCDSHLASAWGPLARHAAGRPYLSGLSGEPYGYFRSARRGLVGTERCGPKQDGRPLGPLQWRACRQRRTPLS